MATHQTASIEIVNHTGSDLLSVSVAHKYSDDYKNEHTWENIKSGATTSTKKVEFNTGLLTTGRDWWVVTWVDDKGHTYVTDPKNFRNIVDFLEKIGSEIAGPMAAIAAWVATGSPEPTTKVIAAAVAITSAVAKQFLNTEGTDGYKQHILREEDKNRPTRIVIKGNEVNFDSTSGSSTTGIRRM
jgi:hypothetical protein